jgi:hypothetical protein
MVWLPPVSAQFASEKEEFAQVVYSKIEYGIED